MNNEYKRMRALLEPAGIDFSSNSISNAEIYAYSEGLGYVRDILNETVKRVFFLLVPDGNANGYASLLKISPKVSEEDLSSEIILRLSRNFFGYGIFQIFDEFEKIGSGSINLEYDSTGRLKCIISDVMLSDIDELSKFIEAFTFCGIKYIYDGSGMTFDEWDETDKTFNEFDLLDAVFDILDKIRRSSS